MSVPVGILISGTGSNMVALVEGMGDPGAVCRPAVVISNRPGAPGLAKAAALGIPTVALDHRGKDRAAFDAEVHSALCAHGTEIVACAGYMRIMTADFVGQWAGRMLNIHPSLLPLFPGLDTHARALAAGVCVHGCTVHEVTADLDAGPILGQAVVPVRPDDTAEALAARVLGLEHVLYPIVIARFAEDPDGCRRQRIALRHPDF